MTIQEKINGLKEQIDGHERQLSHLELQKTKFGSLYLPAYVAIQIEEEKNDIQRLTKEIQRLKQKPDEILPQPSSQQQTVNIVGNQNTTVIQAGRDVCQQPTPSPCPVPEATTTTKNISISDLSKLLGETEIVFSANIAKTSKQVRKGGGKNVKI